jgi:hypothetical protein
MSLLEKSMYCSVHKVYARPQPSVLLIVRRLYREGHTFVFNDKEVRHRSVVHFQEPNAPPQIQPGRARALQTGPKSHEHLIYLLPSPAPMGLFPAHSLNTHDSFNDFVCAIVLSEAENPPSTSMIQIALCSPDVLQELLPPRLRQFMPSTVNVKNGLAHALGLGKMNPLLATLKFENPGARRSSGQH